MMDHDPLIELSGKTHNAHRRRLILSVRTLMLFVLLVAAACGWTVNGANTQRDAVQAIESTGGVVKYDWERSNGLPVKGGKPRGPRWLVDRLGIHYFDTVTFVDYFPKNVTDKDMARLARLKGIDTLSFDARGVSDAGLEQLNHLPRLQYLTFMSASPKKIDVLLRQRILLSRLKGLGLDCPAVTDAHVRGLGKFANLELLSLRHSHVTDAGLAPLTDLPRLQHLYIEDTQITDLGLNELKALPRLKSVQITGTKITRRATQQLGKTRPDLSIAR